MNYNSLPDEIQYGKVRMRGFYTKFTQWPVYPNSSNQYWNNDEIVRFQIDLKQRGTVVDPWRSHIQFTVTVNDQMYPVGGVQVDSSAQSFFSQTVISSNAVQVQRIAQYDVLATILTDLGFSQFVCQNRSGQGLGYTNMPTHVPYSTNQTGTKQIFTTQQNPSGGGLQQIVIPMSYGTIIPVNAPMNAPGIAYTFGGPCPLDFYIGQGAYHVSSLNPFWNPIGFDNVQKQLHDTDLVNLVNQNNRLGSVRYQYLEGLKSKTYIQSNSSYPPLDLKVSKQDFVWNSQPYLKGFNKNNPYSTTTTQFVPIWNNIGMTQVSQNLPTTAGVIGYANPVSAQFSKGSLQPFLSPTVRQVGMQNGQILPHRVPLTQKKFRVPLISAILGVLIPPDQFTLIPLESLYNLILQITLSRYAMFTSGYSDVHQMDINGMQFMLQRKWLLSNFAWNLHLYSFNDQSVIDMIQASLTKQIAITAYGYALSSSYQITTGQNVKGQYNIAAQYQSLCQVYCVFIPNAYQTYSFLRKQFRISNNVSQLQFRINTDFYPIQPITGNAGNPQVLDSTGDNWNFYEMVMLSNNFLFNTNHPSPKINTKNFAINSRPYNYKNVKPLFDIDMFGNPHYQMGTHSFNYDTAMGMSMFHENRCIGKALYNYTWQPYGHSKTYLNGLNTSGTRNFQVIFNTIPQNWYPDDQTLYIFSKYNQVTVYSNNGIQVYGK